MITCTKTFGLWLPFTFLKPSFPGSTAGARQREPQATAKNTKSERCSKPQNSWAIILSTFYPVHGPQDGNELFSLLFPFPHPTQTKRFFSIPAVFLLLRMLACRALIYVFYKNGHTVRSTYKTERNHLSKLAWESGFLLFLDARPGGLWPFFW